MARPTRESTPNKVIAHHNGEHTYAATRPLVRRDDGTKLSSATNCLSQKPSASVYPKDASQTTTLSSQKRNAADQKKSELIIVTN